MGSLNSMNFLMLRDMKNRFKETLKKPGRLIMYLLGLVFVVFIIISSLGMDTPDDPGDPTILILIFFAFFTFHMIMSIYQGLRGTTQYAMQDVNLLFVAPIRARTILLYGIIKSAKTVLFGSWFVLFQVQWLRTGYGIGLGGVLLIWAGYLLFALACELMSVFLYATTAGNPRRKIIAKGFIAAWFVPAALIFIFNVFRHDMDFIVGLAHLLESNAINWTPLVGWTAAGTIALITGESLAALLFLGLVVGFGLVIVGIVLVKDPDFYEHVAAATQTTFETTQALSEGNVYDQLGLTKKSIRVRATGIKGQGASVFFHKHIRESFRMNRFGLWGFSTLAVVVGAGAWAYFSRGGDSEVQIVFMLAAFMVIKFFTLGNAGRGVLEVYSHYIYMVPENPFHKWMFANLESIFKVAVDSLLIFITAGAILGASPFWVITAAFTLTSFVFYVLGASLASYRVNGLASRSLLISLLLMFAMLIPLIPGLIIAIVIGIVVGGSWALLAGVIVFAFWQVGLGMLCIGLSKGVLHTCDMPSLDRIISEIQVQ